MTIYRVLYHEPNELSNFTEESFHLVCTLQTHEDVDILFKYFTEEWFLHGFYEIIRDDRSPLTENNIDCNSISFVSFVLNRNNGKHSAYEVWKQMVYSLIDNTLINPAIDSLPIAIKSTPKETQKVTFNIWVPSSIYSCDPREIVSRDFHNKTYKNTLCYKGTTYRITSNDEKVKRTREIQQWRESRMNNE